MAKRKSTKRQTMIYKTLRRIQKECIQVLQKGRNSYPSNGTRRVTLVTKPGERPGLRLRQTGHILVICDINTT
jgi:hypothetical protein